MVGEKESGGVVDTGFDTMRLPGAPDVVAPDGSDVRILLQLGRGGMAHFELGPGRVSRASYQISPWWWRRRR